MLDVFRVHIISGGSRAARGSLVGRLALLIVIPKCSTLSIRVCLGQVCLSPAETYFSNYHTQSATLPSSLVKSLPLLPEQPPPKRRLLFFAFLFLSSRFSFYFMKVSLVSHRWSRNGFICREAKFSVYQILTMFSSAIDLSLRIEEMIHLSSH